MNHLKQKVKSDGGMKGRIRFTSLKIETFEAKVIDFILHHTTMLPPSLYSVLVARLESICEYRQQVFFNRVHLVGREVFARLLIADTTYTGAINFGALGTSSAAITDTDTTLTTEVARKGVATRSRTTDSVTIDFYYSKSDTNGTYQEFGCFIDGTSSADSGQMFNRVLTGGWAKSASEAMTVSVQIDVNAA